MYKDNWICLLIVFAVISFLFCGCAESRVINEEQAQFRGGIVYAVNEQEPYSGTVIKKSDGEIEWEAKLENGLVMHLKHYHSNGKIELSCSFTGAPFSVIKDVRNEYAVNPYLTEFYEGSADELSWYFEGDVKCWTDEGVLVLEGQFKEGVPYGSFRDYYDNGQIQVLRNYVDGQLDGEFKKWYESGQLDTLAAHKNNHAFGSFKHWDKEGHLMIVAESDENGELLSRIQYDIEGNIVDQK